MGPRSVVASGHMVDAPDRRQPRFPPDQVPRVAAEVSAIFDRWSVGPGTTLIAGAARGTDVIAAEEALKRGAGVRAVLALPRDEFERRSVALCGTDWSARFHRVLKSAETEVLEGPPDDHVFARANARILEIARELGERPHAIVVWNGKEVDDSGGTRDFIRRLAPTGPDERICVIDPTRRAYVARQEPGKPKEAARA